MTQCNPCSTMQPLPRCMSVLTIGDTTFNSTAMHVYIKNHTTDAPYTRIDATTDAAGLLSVDLTDYPQIATHDYEMFATLATATSINDRVTITINAVQYTCFSLQFLTIRDDQGAIITGEDQTLEVA